MGEAGGPSRRDARSGGNKMRRVEVFRLFFASAGNFVSAKKLCACLGRGWTDEGGF